jgi:VWFA-related protein
MTGLLPLLGFAFLLTPPPEVAGESVQVLEVEVEVEVFDREGQPVPGLSAADFRVRDEGQVRPIVRFEPWEEAAFRERFEEPTASPSGLRRGRHLLLLFDLTYTNPLQLQRARQALKDWVLHVIPPADYVAVAAVSMEQGSRWLAGFSRDRAQTARAIDGVSLDRLAEDRALDPLRLLVVPPSSVELSTGSAASREGLREEIASIGGEVAEIEAELAAREARRYEAQRVEVWARAVRGLLERLAVLPVRKHVLLVSEGFDARLFQGREQTALDEAQQDANRSAAGQFWRIDPEERFGSSPVLDALYGLVQAARRGNSVLYSLDPGGLRAFGETQRFGRSRGADSLFYLAQETGGELLLGLERALERVAQRARGSYHLAFRADEVPANGAFRRLRVELIGRRGLKVIHRPGWYAPRPFAELHPFERELLAADRIVRAEGGPRGLSVSLAAPAFYGGKEAAYVPVLVEVPTSFSGGRVPEFELFVYALDGRTGTISSFSLAAVALARSASLPAGLEVLR